MSMVVWRGQWVPKCNPDGTYAAKQCDNAGINMLQRAAVFFQSLATSIYVHVHHNNRGNEPGGCNKV